MKPKTTKKGDKDKGTTKTQKYTSSLEKYFNSLYHLKKDDSIRKEKEELEQAFNSFNNGKVHDGNISVVGDITIDDSFSEKVVNIKLLFQKKEEDPISESIKIFTTSGQSLDSLIIGMPSELMALVNKEIEFCLESGCGPDEVKRRINTIIYLLHLAYKDSRQYLDIYGRNYQEMLLADFISEICDLEYTNDDWHRIARVNFDLNGLRTVNEFGIEGHHTGNKLLEIFTDILRNGRTVRALESMGVRVVASAEGGDKFGWILYGTFDLRPLLPIVEKLLLDELDEVEIGHFINFEDQKVQELLKEMGVQSDSKSKFKLTVSVGSASLGEVLGRINIPDDVTYEGMGKIIMNTMFRIADERARKNKNEQRKKLKKENPALYALHSKSNIDILEDRIKELTQELEKVKSKSK